MIVARRSPGTVASLAAAAAAVLAVAAWPIVTSAHAANAATDHQREPDPGVHCGQRPQPAFKSLLNWQPAG